MTDIHTWLLCNWHIANNWHIFTHGSQWLLCPRRFSRLTTGDRNPLWLWYHVLLACCEYLWICVRIHVNICEYLLIYVNILKTNIWKISAMVPPWRYLSAFPEMRSRKIDKINNLAGHPGDGGEVLVGGKCWSLRQKNAGVCRKMGVLRGNGRQGWDWDLAKLLASYRYSEGHNFNQLLQI